MAKKQLPSGQMWFLRPVSQGFEDHPCYIQTHVNTSCNVFYQNSRRVSILPSRIQNWLAWEGCNQLIELYLHCNTLVLAAGRWFSIDHWSRSIRVQRANTQSDFPRPSYHHPWPWPWPPQPPSPSSSWSCSGSSSWSLLRSTALCVPQEEEAAGRGGETEAQPLIQDQPHVSHQVMISYHGMVMYGIVWYGMV